MWTTMAVTLPPADGSVHEAIEREEARLRTLETERAETEGRLRELRATLVTVDAAGRVQTGPSREGPTPPRSSTEKVRLFRSLFRGREDLYPTRWVSKKTGKAGYAPACANKFVAGVCELPKVKCGDCTKQAFRRVDDAAVLQHLRGQHVMGVYPMLSDETCWFLAADFDKGTWKEDVRAFVETSRRLGLLPLVERSRSGNGAHVWFFFSEPIAVATARRMGSHLITETMEARHELSMDSYDRLFPSQDTMPRRRLRKSDCSPAPTQSTPGRELGLPRRGSQRLSRRGAMVHPLLCAARRPGDCRADRFGGDARRDRRRRSHRRCGG